MISKVYNGIIIKEENYKEFDKLLTFLTKESGKISVYAFGVRRPNSKNIGNLDLFRFLSIEVTEKDDKYTLVSSKLIKSFDDIAKDYDKVCIASYFLKLISYFSYENIESDEIYNLIYYTFKALMDSKVPLRLIRRIFELKILFYEGIYKDSSKLSSDDSTLRYTWDFIIKNKPDNLYTFTLKDNILKLLEDELDAEYREKVLNYKDIKYENIVR